MKFEKLNLYMQWKRLSRKEKKTFIFGMVFALILTFPFVFIKTAYSPPAGYGMSIIENKILYNGLYEQFYGEVGNATDGDKAVIITFNLTDSIYKNVAIIPSGSDEIYIYAICFYDTDNKVFEIINNPVLDEIYIIDAVENIRGLIIFLHSGELILTCEIWIW